MQRYTQGIRKLFCTNKVGVTRQEAAEMALNAGYNLMLWNGQVYRLGTWVKGGEKTVIKTGLELTDFEF